MTAINTGEDIAATAADPAWSTEDSATLYGIDGWGQGYFRICDSGRVVATDGDGQPIEILEVVEGLAERGFHTPIVIRFSDILLHRMKTLSSSFHRAMRENGYRGSYAAVFPVKVNQQRRVVADVYKFGESLGFGLEVGSKPELLAVLAMSHLDERRLIICNGFKDERYIDAVILATKLGRTIIPVVENFEELRLIVDAAKRYDVKPRIGVRVKLASQGAGRWRESVGAKSKFGLFVSEIVEMVEVLREHDLLSGLELVHCHIGSQIHDIRAVKDAVNEISHVYVELARLGAGMKYVDVGGGLGVDYDGSQSSSDGSMNYSLDEYASDIVYRIGAVCDEAGFPHPTIVSESGRAMVAHSSVLVFDILGVTSRRCELTTADLELARSAHGAPPLRDLAEAHDSLTPDRLLEYYHDVVQARDAALHLFNLGYLSLVERGLAERLFWATCQRIAGMCAGDEEAPEELGELSTILSDVYFGNFSLFQSLPDSWAVDQLFPIMPIHRLSEEPETNAVIADITCDSDGRIDRFVQDGRLSDSVRLHTFRRGERYYIGVFLVGAYQETLGDLHNLFGDTHVVHIRSDDRSGWWIEESIRGDTSREVLSYLQFDVKQLLSHLGEECEHAARDGRLTVREAQTLLRFYESGLDSYTYLEPENGRG